MTKMSGFLGRGLKNSARFGRFYLSVQFLLKWTFWSTLLVAGGCVVPVEPQFQDPPSSPNFYPYLSNADPIAQTSSRLPPAPAMLEFNIQVGDQNLDDTLYVRWVSDYPPYTPGISKIVVDGADGEGLLLPPTSPPGEIRGIPAYKTRCEDFFPAATHSLTVIVSDRPFLPSNQPFGGDLRYNLVPRNAMNQPVTYPLMTGWTIEGCL